MLAVALLAALAACSTGGGSSSSAGGLSKAKVSALSSDVNQGASTPQFSTYAAGYGSKVKSIANLRGKKIMIVPGNSELAACTEIAQADAALATSAGMKPTIFANQGTTSQYNTAIENAIHGGYAAIDAECDFDPTLVAPSIAQAQKAGIAVAVYGDTPQEAAKAKIKYSTVDPYQLDAKYAAEQAVAQAGGKPFKAIAITSNAAPATAIMQNALTSELKSICPGCTVSDYDVEVPNWTTDVSRTVTSALLQHPDATVLFPDYAGMLTYVLEGVQAAHATTKVKTYLAFGGGTPFIKLQATDPGKSIIQSDIGGYPPWTGYLLFLQTARELEHMSPIPYDKAIGPDRIATPGNAGNVLATGGWGTSWVNGFRGLLGLPSLSGSALTSASTLNGAMTAAP
ncbi:MAG: substrate-binding domain-containing protein [Streptosporangiales bacterium]|nr:substrate-binding domain-containing protein [Streptosporangiales bacterium]